MNFNNNDVNDILKHCKEFTAKMYLKIYIEILY